MVGTAYDALCPWTLNSDRLKDELPKNAFDWEKNKKTLMCTESTNIVKLQY